MDLKWATHAFSEQDRINGRDSQMDKVTDRQTDRRTNHSTA